jgi:hypothetical protein
MTLHLFNLLAERSPSAFRITLTQPLVRKSSAGRRFQVALKFNRLSVIGKRDIRHQTPRLILVRVMRAPLIMRTESSA